jgi:hypothetical protein
MPVIGQTVSHYQTIEKLGCAGRDSAMAPSQKGELVRTIRPELTPRSPHHFFLQNAKELTEKESIRCYPLLQGGESICG